MVTLLEPLKDRQLSCKIWARFTLPLQTVSSSLARKRILTLSISAQTVASNKLKKQTLFSKLPLIKTIIMQQWRRNLLRKLWQKLISQLSKTHSNPPP